MCERERAIERERERKNERARKTARRPVDLHVGVESPSVAREVT